jgi:hypothetical protein
MNDIRYVAPPAKTSRSGSFGGMLSFIVADAGLYRLILGAGAWIDILKDDKPATAVAYCKTPKRWGICKDVEFELSDGAYVLQLSGSLIDILPLLIMKVS